MAENSTRRVVARDTKQRFVPNQLLVQLKPAQARTMLRGVRSVSAIADAGLSTGLTVLGQLERQGLVKRVVPLERDAPPPPRAVAMRLVRSAATRTLTSAADGSADLRAPVTMLAAAQSRGDSALAGVTLVELEKGADENQLLSELNRDPAIEMASRVPMRFAMTGPRAARASGPARNASVRDMWNLGKIRWAEAKRLGSIAAKGVKVAVLDTGIDRGHPRLASRVKRYVHYYPEEAAPSGDQDICGHGTHVAGTIAARLDKDGLSGVSGCNLYVWKIFGDETTLFEDGPDSSWEYFVSGPMYLSALDQVRQSGINVLNLSIGSSYHDPFEARSIKRLIDAGVIVVAAMGNERTLRSPTSYPAALDDVIAVGSTDRTDTVSYFSNSGAHILLAAPGEQIWSTLPTYPGNDGWRAVPAAGGGWKKGAKVSRGREFGLSNGTSMAAPHVTAAVALYLSRHPGATRSDVVNALKKSVDSTPHMRRPVHSRDYGWGRLNLETLLK